MVEKDGVLSAKSILRRSGDLTVGMLTVKTLVWCAHCAGSKLYIVTKWMFIISTEIIRTPIKITYSWYVQIVIGCCTYYNV